MRVTPPNLLASKVTTVLLLRDFKPGFGVFAASWGLKGRLTQPEIQG